MPLSIQAVPVACVQETVGKEWPIAILLGTQLRFLLDKIKEQFTGQNIPVTVIDPEIYGLMDREKALKEVLKLIKNNK